MSEKWVLGYEISETGITGRRVGLLVALGRIKASGKVLCACDCGGHTTVYYSNFGRGDHTNCGCQISANRKRLKGPVPSGHAGKPGTGPAGETCWSCVHIYRNVLAKTYLKCGLNRAMWTGGRKSDIRARDAACLKWAETEQQS